MEQNRKRNLTSADQALLDAERRGLKLAIKGRTAALTLVTLWFVLAASGGPDLFPALPVLPFILTGIIHHLLIGSRYDRRWLKYAFFTIDVLALGSIVILADLSRGGDVPQIIAFRAYGPYYALIMLPLAALSLSPGLLLWTGSMVCVAWWGAFLFVVSGMEQTVSWSDLPPGPTAAQYLEVFLSPNFIGTGNRIEETGFIMITTLLLALAVHRARGVVRAHAESEAARRQVEQAFGRYVPEQVVDRILEGPDAMAPSEREATILFLDIQGFTTLSERLAPAELIALLSDFFDESTEVISRFDGVVVGYAGDALLASFNAPLATGEHAAQAVKAGGQLLDMVEKKRFSSEQLSIRIGIATGPIAAGSVGGHRQSYTVYGDTVNLAQRLEEANKTYGTRMLIARPTLAQIEGLDAKFVGNLPIRGREGTVDVFAVGS
ncbi:MAG: adenylate/guanylate cyclase domain-containing protein [Pseudomonadota bacterium]